jgi:hypothetical protein
MRTAGGWELREVGTAAATPQLLNRITPPAWFWPILVKNSSSGRCLTIHWRTKWYTTSHRLGHGGSLAESSFQFRFWNTRLAIDNRTAPQKNWMIEEDEGDDPWWCCNNKCSSNNESLHSHTVKFTASIFCLSPNCLLISSSTPVLNNQKIENLGIISSNPFVKVLAPLQAVFFFLSLSLHNQKKLFAEKNLRTKLHTQHKSVFLWVRVRRDGIIPSQQARARQKRWGGRPRSTGD